MRSETYYTITLSLNNSTQSVDSVNNQPMFTPKTQFIGVLDTKLYLFFSTGIDLGGFLMKYSNKSLIIYDTERSFSFASLSRKFFISSVIRKLKDTDFTSFIVVQCTTLFICISNIKTLIYTTHCSTVQCDTYRK